MTAQFGGSRARVLALSYLLIGALTLLDWVTPAGIVVGMMLAIPIMLLSLLDRPRDVLTGAAVALAGYTVAAALGAPAVSPPRVTRTNTAFAVLGMLMGTAAALEIQRHRLAATRALAAAVTARDLNRLLMSLLAHDLRAPLVAASHAVEYVRRSTANGTALDLDLLADTGRRLARNLRMIESVLHVARLDLARAGDADARPYAYPALAVAEHLTREVARFADEATARGQSLRLSADALGDLELPVDSLVLTHTLAILLDNAIQHGLPGPITIEAMRAPGALVIRVADSGPGLGAHRRNRVVPQGSGLGLELCRAMVARARGSLVLEQDSPRGTVFRLTLPVADDSRASGRMHQSRESWPASEAMSPVG